LIIDNDVHIMLKYTQIIYFCRACALGKRGGGNVYYFNKFL
jgi:hypothetical protein